jgi:hypothetical protein
VCEHHWQRSVGDCVLVREIRFRSSASTAISLRHRCQLRQTSRFTFELCTTPSYNCSREGYELNATFTLRSSAMS